MIMRMKAAGLTVIHKVLDNEASALYKQSIKESGMTHKLVSPSNHRHNIAERVIQTWKAHFIVNLNGIAKEFTMHLWDLIIPQAEQQLLLLR